MLGLYLHIPFCSSICNYCNFNRGLFDAALKARYVDALEQEILRTGRGEAVDTIYFGGGTPSLLEPAEIGAIVEDCRAVFDVSTDVEVTLETNPETATTARLAGFREAGVNRLSFGVQSFQDSELARLGRVHSSARARDAVAEARAAGFDNVSLDLMMWLPGQSVDDWTSNVRALVDVRPEHVSFYLLELYPNAPLKEEMARAGWSLAPDEDAAAMYLVGLDILEAAGYRQYEISNACVANRESRHNMKYWTDGAWHGFGCGAHSTRNGDPVAERVGDGGLHRARRRARDTDRRSTHLDLGRTGGRGDVHGPPTDSWCGRRFRRSPVWRRRLGPLRRRAYALHRAGVVAPGRFANLVESRGYACC
jgi:oxygen-independent coproporphyrinogen-3 oxidase